MKNETSERKVKTMNGIKNTTRLVELLALVTAPFVLIALVFILVFADHTQKATAVTAGSTASHRMQTVSMTVVTDAQTGRAGYIAMVPSNITLPAHSTVRIRITNFDGATPQKPAIYAKAWGTVGGTIQVQSFKTTSPNRLTTARTVRSLAAATQVSHTFTVMGMHLNVPVLASGVTTFIVHTGAPGHYRWQCFNPCGDGASGWMGPMADMGYMKGMVTVA
jgi:heme/copper-type cytochrome/quinol oxidase subunit 2